MSVVVSVYIQGLLQLKTAANMGPKTKQRAATSVKMFWRAEGSCRDGKVSLCAWTDGKSRHIGQRGQEGRVQIVCHLEVTELRYKTYND